MWAIGSCMALGKYKSYVGYWGLYAYMVLHNMTYLRRLYYTWGLYYTCIWASGCCMRASGGFMGQLYAVSYSVHVAWGLLEALWKL